MDEFLCIFFIAIILICIFMIGKVTGEGKGYLEGYKLGFNHGKIIGENCCYKNPVKLNTNNNKPEVRK